MKLFSTALYLGCLCCLWVLLGLARAQRDTVQPTSEPIPVQADTAQGGTPELLNVAAVRLAHVSPDAPLLDLLVDGKLRFQDVNFTALSSYLVLPAGEHELRVQPHRASNNSSTEASNKIQAPEPFIISVTLEPGRYYTLVASGFFDPPPAQDELGALSLSMTEGTSASVTGPRAYATTLTESSELTELLPGTYTITASQEGFKTAQYEAEVRPNETALLSIALQASSDGETSEEAVAAVNNSMTSGNNSTTSGPEWHKVQVQLYEDELSGFPPAGSVYLRVIHASPVTPSVSVVLVRREQAESGTDKSNSGQAKDTSEPIVTNLAYPNKVDYLSVAAGRVSLRLQDATTNQVMTELENLELRAGTIYTFFVVGTRDDNFVSLIPTLDAILAGEP
jgi:hypothetical protein